MADIYHRDESTKFSATSRGFNYYAVGAQAALQHFLANGQWAGFASPDNATTVPVDLEQIEVSGITTLAENDNGGVAVYINENGQIVVTDEDSRYTETCSTTTAPNTSIVTAFSKAE